MNRIEYVQQVIHLEKIPEWTEILEKIAAFPDLVIVNAAASPDGQSVLFIPDNVLPLAATGIASLYLDAIPAATFSQLLSERLVRLIDESLVVKKQLRIHYASNLHDKIQDYLSHCQNAALFLLCVNSQRPNPNIKTHFENFQNIIEQMSLSSFYYEDNVKCMDTLEYAIIPCLKQLNQLIQSDAKPVVLS